MVIDLCVHRLKHCKDEYCMGCYLCSGGLAQCEVCGGAEASLPTDCPGASMQEIVEDGVQAGEIDFRRWFGWIQK